MTRATPDGFPSKRWSNSFWHSEPSSKLLGYRSTANIPEHADVVIVGSGITAAGAAWRLLRGSPKMANGRTDSFSVIMLEAREACWGATGRNGGHCFPIVYDHPEDPRIGNFELANLRAIEALIRELDIDCEYHPQSSVRALYSDSDLGETIRALAVLEANDAGLAEHARLVTDSAELNRLRVPLAKGATVSNAAARLWAYKFVARILEELVFPPAGNRQYSSLNLQTNTPVTSLYQAEKEDLLLTGKRLMWKLTTPRGVITAPRVILATNGYASALLPEFSDVIIPCRGQAAALLPPSDASGKKRLNSNYIFAGQGFYDYLVQRSDEQGGHLIFGGGCETWGLGSADDSVIDNETAMYLRRRLKDHLGLSKTSDSIKTGLDASHQWTGIMGYSRDGIPWVGPVPSRPGVFIAAGYTGNGMPNAFLCGHAVAAMVTSDLQGLDQEAVVLAAVENSEIGLPRAYLVSRQRIEEAWKLEFASW